MLSSALGTLLAALVISRIIALGAAKNTSITCAYCGEATPMSVVTEGGIGAVNAGMKQHIERCTFHPMYETRRELKDARQAMKTIYGWAGLPEPRVEDIHDLAGRFH